MADTQSMAAEIAEKRESVGLNHTLGVQFTKVTPEHL